MIKNSDFYSKYSCKFDAETHTYYLVDSQSGEKVKTLISVTQLLHKHNLAPDYAKVSKSTLSKAADKGTAIHKAIEDYVNLSANDGSEEVADFIRLMHEQKLVPQVSEMVVYDEEIAGTIDLLSLDKQHSVVLSDIKTPKVFPKEYTRWQLSVYAHLWRKMGGAVAAISGLSIVAGKSKYVPLEEVSKEDLFDLLMAEREGEIHEERSITLKDKTQSSIIALDAYIRSLEEQIASAEKEYRAIQERVKRQMETVGVKSFENDHFKISYIAAHETVRLDSKRLKEEAPDIYAEFSKKSVVESSVRITMRDGK